MLLQSMHLRCASFLLALKCPSSAAEPSWPQFRGTNSQGIAAAGEKPPVIFGPEKLCFWKTPVPAGISSPCIWGDRIFLTAVENDKLLLLGIERKTGRILW